jgi:hypothetical protein
MGFRISFFIILCSLFACQKDEQTSPNPDRSTGSVVIKFDNRFGTTKLLLDGTEYQNALGETLVISRFDYYISNIKLQRLDGSFYTVPQDSSYFLVREEQLSSQRITLRNVPLGEYKSISFTIGVDSLRSTMPLAQRTGMLDPGTSAADMYWTWNSGYIFVKMEGSSPAIAADPSTGKRNFWFHIGGFGGYKQRTINNLRQVTLPVSEGTLSVTSRQTRASSFHIIANAAKMLEGVQKVSLAKNPVVMFNPFSSTLADNYAAGMFNLSHVENY